jgi:hypothetical protein
MERDAGRLAECCLFVLGNPVSWPDAPEYSSSLSLCIVDAIFSGGVRGMGAEAVHYYRRLLLAEGNEPEGDTSWLGASTQALVRRVTPAGGAQGEAKVAAVQSAARALASQAILTATDLRHADEGQLAAAGRGWCTIATERSGMSWHYFLMLSASPSLLPDRRLARFVSRCLDRNCSLAEAHRLTQTAATAAGVEFARLYRAIWDHETRPEGRALATGTSAASQHQQACTPSIGSP